MTLDWDFSIQEEIGTEIEIEIEIILCAEEKESRYDACCERKWRLFHCWSTW